MSRNLEHKIKLLVQDLVHLSDEAKARAIQRLIQSELEMVEEVKYFDYHDLMVLQARAASILSQEPLQSQLMVESKLQNQDFLRVACIVQATIEVLRARKLLPHLVGFRKNVKDSNGNTFCGHSKVSTQLAGYVRYTCLKCLAEVKPILWDLEDKKD